MTGFRWLRPAVATWALLGVVVGAQPSEAFWPFGRDPLPDLQGDLPGAASALLSRAIQVRTVNPPGDERPLADVLVRVLRHQGLEARVIATPNGSSTLGRAAAWARLAGSGQKPAIVLLSHLDVVPADQGSWAVDPFAGVVVGGYVVGRGALDAKGVAVVQMLALAELARRGTRLNRDVIFLAVPDEEMGGRTGAGYLVRRHPELLYGAQYLLTEGGSILVGGGARANVWGVAVTEKAPCWVRLTATGRPGHAATAGRDGAVPRLLSALERLQRMPRPIRVVPAVERMFATLAPLAAAEDRAGFAHLAAELERDPDFRQRFLSDGARAALVRDTLAITVLRGAPRTNVLPAVASAEVDARLLPGQDCNSLLETIAAAIDDPSVGIDPILAFAPRRSSADTDLFRAIQAVAAEIDPGAIVVPRLISGFTDAHYFRDLGIVSYGFVPRWLPAAETHGIHGTNERISVENLARGVRTLVRLLEVFGGAATPSDSPSRREENRF